MSAEHRVVGDYDPIAQVAIVGNVASDHEKVVVANSRDAILFFSAPIDGAMFAKGIAVANFNTRRGVFVAGVLRMRSDHATGEDVIVFAERA